MASQKYHLNPESGNPGICRAQEGNCPFGDSNQHYGSEAEARRAYELTQELGELTPNALLGKLNFSPPSGKIALLGLLGSRAYGMAREDSDYDLRAIYQAPPRQLLTLDRPQDTIDRTEPDATMWELNHFARLAANANPNILELLWAPDANLGPVVGLPSASFSITDPTGQTLRAHRKLFISKLALHSYGGYATAQLKKAQAGTGGSRGVKHLQREKFIRHLFRLFDQGAQLLETGDMDIRVKDPEKLMAQGKWELSKVEEEFAKKDALLKELAEKSDIPARPDMEAINDLLYRIRLGDLRASK